MRWVLVIALVWSAIVPSVAQTNGDRRWNYIAVRSRLTMTVKERGTELVTLTFAPDTFVAISDGTVVSGPRPYQGTVEVRARVKSAETVGPAAEMMRDAALVLKGTNLEVVVKND